MSWSQMCGIMVCVNGINACLHEDNGRLATRRFSPGYSPNLYRDRILLT